MRRVRVAVTLAVTATACTTASDSRRDVDLSPDTWMADYDRFMAAQLVDRTEAGVATGTNGAVTLAYNGLAARRARGGC